MNDYLSRWRTKTGAELVMRLMRAEDAQRVKIALNRLSPESRRNRYFRTVADFSDAMVSELVDLDPLKQWGVLVVHIENGIEIPVAGGRIVAESNVICEFSLVIDDHWQGQGVGRHIMQALIDEASRRGMLKMKGYVMSENRSMIALARSIGFRVNKSEEDESLTKVVRDLAGASPDNQDSKIIHQDDKTSLDKTVQSPPV